MAMSRLQHVFVAVILTQLALFLDFSQGVQTEKQDSVGSSLTDPDHAAKASTRVLRQKRAPGWGKRADEELDAFDGGDNDDDLLDGLGDADVLETKRAPGWGKRAPGWGKRAPGWGKRAPGWGKRAPGWGKRAPGWGKRGVSEAEEKRAPGWGKRAPGWGKRAPGWGKRAPGWGKRSVEGMSGECKLWSQELEVILDRAIETETRLQAFCGSGPTAFDLTSRK